MKNRLPVAQLIRLALDKTAYDAILLTEFLGERKLANLYKLIEQARGFDESGVFSLADFITQLSEFVVRQPKEPLAATHAESMDVVRLMSIHQSKGLEFPVVFVADLDRRLGSQPPPAVFSPVLGPLVKDAEIPSGFNLFMQTEIEEDRAETVRLFYVAATRAADYLILSAGIEEPKDEENDDRNNERQKGQKTYEPKGEWMQLLARHFDLFSGEPVKAGKPVKVIAAKPEFENPPEDLTVRRRLKTVAEETCKLAEREEGLLPPYLGPISAEESARRQLSFSQLSGKIKHSPSPMEDINDIPFLPVGEGPGVRAVEALDDSSESVIDPLSLGTLVHAVLAEVDFTQPKNLAALLERHAAEHIGDDRAAIAQATEMLERFLLSPRERYRRGESRPSGVGIPARLAARRRTARRPLFPRLPRLALSGCRRRMAHPRFQNQCRHRDEYGRGRRELRTANAGLCLGGRKDIKMSPAGISAPFSPHRPGKTIPLG